VRWAAASRDKKTMTMVMGDEDDDSGGCLWIVPVLLCC
jgi:hypothetical protein